MSAEFPVKGFVLFAVFALLTGGCGFVKFDQMKDANDLATARGAYKNCARQYPDEPQKCGALKEAYLSKLNSARARDP